MYSIGGLCTYTDQWVSQQYEHWSDPDTNFTSNETTFYQNEMDNNFNINEIIYESNDFNEYETDFNEYETEQANEEEQQFQQEQQEQEEQEQYQQHQLHQQHFGYNLSSYVFVPYYGALQQNPVTSPSFPWHQQLVAPRTYLSGDAMPFIPAKSGTHLMDGRAAEVLAHFTTAKSAKTVPTSSSPSSSQRSTTTHNKSPRKKHSATVSPNKWSKQNGRDEFSSNEDLATCSGDVANVTNYDEDPGVVDDVNTSESESSPKIRRKHKKKSTPRQRGSCKKIATNPTYGNEENKENNCPSSNLYKIDRDSVSKQLFATDRFMIEFNRCRAITPPLREHIKLNLPEEKLMEYLIHYRLNSNELKVQGYPYRYGTQAGFFNNRFDYKKRFSATTEYGMPPVSTIAFDVNAREFVPSHKRRNCERKLSCDSGQATGSSSSSSPSTDSDSSDNTGEMRYTERTEKKCIRCTREFHVTEHGEYLKMETCTFHWGKLQRSSISYSTGGTYTCCNSPKFSKGCTISDGHVWNGYEIGFNGPLDGFVRTEDSDKIDNDMNVFALDCEMVYTGKGLEVAKVTLVSSDGQKVYEKFVRPATKIIDYNTRFSGITKKDLATKNNQVATLPEVQQDLLQFINADTFLIGHALHNDLRVLKIIHDNVIDTSVCFLHDNGPDFKHSLRFLTSKYLNRTIQDSDQGHSSFEDSRACLELVLYRVRKDFRIVLEHGPQYK